MDLDVEPMIFKEQSNFLDKISEWGFITNPLSQTSGIRY